MTRTVLCLAAILQAAVAAPALAQEQQAAAPGVAGQQTYEIVSADRETAWRLNRSTGEITVCRVDTTASLDATVRARCAPASMEGASAPPARVGGGPQQSLVPGGTPEAPRP